MKMGHLAHDICAEYDDKLKSSLLPAHDPYLSNPCIIMCLLKSFLYHHPGHVRDMQWEIAGVLQSFLLF